VNEKVKQSVFAFGYKVRAPTPEVKGHIILNMYFAKTSAGY
jgi:hypothetical protein